MRSITALDLSRAFLVLTGAVCQALFAFRPDLFGIDATIGGTAREYETVLVPAGVAFAIWLPLFAGSFAFALYHALPGCLRDPLMARVGWCAGLSYAVNSVWALHQPVFGPGWVSFALLEAILLPLLVAIFFIRRAAPQRLLRNIFLAPIFALAGWITVASPAGFTLAARIAGWTPADLGPIEFALATLAAWALPALIVVFAARSLVYAGAIVWGLSFVALANATRGEEILVLAASGLAVVVALIAALGKVTTRRRPAAAASDQ